MKTVADLLAKKEEAARRKRQELAEIQKEIDAVKLVLSLMEAEGPTNGVDKAAVRSANPRAVEETAQWR